MGLLKRTFPQIILTGLFFLLVVVLFISDPFNFVKPANKPVTDQDYQIYRADGSLASLSELLEEVRLATVVFLGEGHNDPVAHYLEALIFEKSWSPGMALSMEMFETDTQYVLDEYLNGMIKESHLIKSGRAWQNYDDDYKPLIEFAKEKQIPVIAANAPRRYVNIVSRKGKEALLPLSEQAKQYLPPLPYAEATTAYADKFRALMLESGEGQRGTNQGDQVIDPAETALKIERTLQAQSLWDASMAWSISRYLTDNPDSRILHLNGSFHSAERMGILDHIRHYRPETLSLVISMIADDSFTEFNSDEMSSLGDFVILTNAALPRSY